MELAERYSMSRNITLIGAVANLFLGLAKVVIGVIGNSQALVADGVHSFSDLLTDGLVLFASKYGCVEADRDHPYGHGRIETAATMLLALLLILAGLGISIDAIRILWSGVTEHPSSFVLSIAIISIISKEVMYQWTMRVAQELNSELLKANAWHHRSDAISSIVVLIGVGGALLGVTHFDDVAAVIVGLMIIKMGWSLGWSSVQELVDTAVDAETLAQIKTLIAKIPGVDEIHQLRTRSMSGKILVDVHVIVDPTLTVSEGHYIGHQVDHTLTCEMPNVTDVTVHIDPEDDEVHAPSSHLPSRQILLPQLKKCLQGLPGANDISKFSLHYLDSGLDIDIQLPVSLLNENAPEQLEGQYTAATNSLSIIRKVRLKFYT